MTELKTQREIDAEILRRRDIINSDLYKFYLAHVATEARKPVPADHLMRLADELMALYRGDFKDICISMPPRHGKSSMATIAFPLWCLLHDPSLNIIIVTHSKNLCETQGIRLRECVKRFGHEFGIKISSTKKSSTSFKFDDLKGNLLSGSVHLVTVGSKDITGFDCDILIIDDPYSADLSDFTPSALEKIIDWYKLKIVQRKEPQTRRIILHTRYHSNDIIGYLKRNSNDLYHFITFPAIKPNGEFLWPERGNQNEILEAKKEMGERLFNAIYQQRPLDLDGDFFDMKAIKFDLEEPDVVRTVRGWDLGGTRTEEMNDFTAGALMVRTSNDECVLMDMKHGKYGKTTMDTVVRTAELDTQFVTIVGETGAAGSADILEEEWKKYLPGYNFVRARMPTTSKKGLAKQDNATPLKNCIHDGRFYINIKDMVLRADILEEMSQFPLGKHDDMIDAMAHAYNELFGMGKTAAVGVAYLKNRKRNNNGVRAW